MNKQIKKTIMYLRFKLLGSNTYLGFNLKFAKDLR